MRADDSVPTIGERPARGELVAQLDANRRAFLSFLERRVGHREVAEDVLQEAYARSLDKMPLESGESAVAWFYRVLRSQLDEEATPAPDERDAVCGCVARLSETLKPEYAAALRRIDVEGVSIADYAAENGITPNNARVRVFRAREALRKRVVRWCGACAERGCIDCTCGEPGSTGCAHGSS